MDVAKQLDGIKSLNNQVETLQTTIKELNRALTEVKRQLGTDQRDLVKHYDCPNADNPAVGHDSKGLFYSISFQNGYYYVRAMRKLK